MTLQLWVNKFGWLRVAFKFFGNKEFDCGGPQCTEWSARMVARWLGVSHTYVQKLIRQFELDPDRMQEEMQRQGFATFEQLKLAREHTRQERARGTLRRAAQTSYWVRDLPVWTTGFIGYEAAKYTARQRIAVYWRQRACTEIFK